MKILVTNDDGIYSSGIYELWNVAKEFGDVTVVAPSTQKSAVGHGITIDKPLYIKQIDRGNGFKGNSISGTPADCVKIGIKKLTKSIPNLVLSGINIGSNLGNNIIYSGTVAAAVEGAVSGIPSIAFSLDSFSPNSFATSKAVIYKVLNLLLDNKPPTGTILNVNIPNCKPEDLKGYRSTFQGKQYFDDNFDERIDPRGRKYYWMTGKINDDDEDLDCDGFAVKNNYVSITPINFEMTNIGYINELKTIFENEEN